MTWPELAVSCLLAYLIGAIPFSWLFVRVLDGIDLRTVGSGNLGSTNAMRVLGTPLGLVIQALDILKGWLPVFALLTVTNAVAFIYDLGVGFVPLPHPPPISVENAALVAGIAAVLGHMFPVYMRFRGGKGVNTTLGVFLALAPKATLVALVAGLAVLAATRYVSLGSIIGSIALLLAVWFFYRQETALIIVTATLALLIVFMHRSNIRRLLAGTEPRLGSKIVAEESREGKPGSNKG
jgi:glycerol-3-phosphate acyltransferase PlsY